MDSAKRILSLQLLQKHLENKIKEQQEELQKAAPKIDTNNSHILMFPVRIMGDKNAGKGYSDYHITLKHFGDIDELNHDDIQKIVDFHQLSPPKLTHIKPESWVSKKDGSSIHILKVKGDLKNLEHANHDLSKEMPNLWPYSAHISIPKGLHDRLKSGELQGSDLGIEVGPLEYRIGDKRVKSFLPKTVKAEPASSKKAVKLNPEHGKIIANAYESMEHRPNDPNVKSAYNALIKETADQYRNLINSGFKISKMLPNQNNPYPTSKHLHHDIENNNHMWYYPTEQGFGSNNNQYKDHPMLQATEFKNNHGETMLANDIFRVVHDTIHNKLKNGFGPKGEHEAYLEHKKMYSPLAQKALASETMGQNSTVNFGTHAKHNRENPAATIFADQKAGLLPDYIINGAWHE